MITDSIWLSHLCIYPYQQLSLYFNLNTGHRTNSVPNCLCLSLFKLGVLVQTADHIGRDHNWMMSLTLPLISLSGLIYMSSCLLLILDCLHTPYVHLNAQGIHDHVVHQGFKRFPKLCVLYHSHASSVSNACSPNILLAC